MNAEKAEKYLRHLMAELRSASKRWCSADVDDAEEMYAEYPEFIHENLDAVEEALEVPRTNLRIISAVYGADPSWIDVADNIKLKSNFNSLDLRVDNYAMVGDPAPGRAKELHLRYFLNGQEHNVIVPEGRRLRIRDGLGCTII